MVKSQMVWPKFEIQNCFFEMKGCWSGDDNWYDFILLRDRKEIIGLGGADPLMFADDMQDVLSKKNGVKLSELKAPMFLDDVGGFEAQYLGNISFSGYATMYFFMLNSVLSTIVVAGPNGNSLLSVRVLDGDATIWLDKTVEFRNKLRGVRPTGP